MVLRIINYFFLLFLFSSCRKDKGEIDYSDTHYPQNIAKIISRSCAVTGCHNQISKGAAANLSLSTWENLFQGASGGPVVIPYRPDFSTLCFYTNSFSELGPISNPSMPINATPLTREEYLCIKNWILDGAPDYKGRIKFADNPNRSKFYITNQLCDVVTVIDAETKLPMRYINVGNLALTDFPVCLKVSPDKNSWYVSFLALNGFLQKYNCTDDSYLSQVSLGTGVWSSFDISSNSQYGFCIDNSSTGRVSVVDLNSMNIITTYTSPNFYYPKNAAIQNSLSKLYLGADNGNYISVIDYSVITSPVIKEIILDGTSVLNTTTANGPANLLVDEFYNRCYVSCANTSEIKVIDTSKDSVITSIPLNAGPGMLVLSPQKKLLFVSCMNDSISFPGNKGSVKVIDLQTLTIKKTLYSGYQPNGLSVNDLRQYVLVVNSNINPAGPAPHHVSGCGGRNGYVSYIDLNSLEMIPSKRFELATYPYSAAIRK